MTKNEIIDALDRSAMDPTDLGPRNVLQLENSKIAYVRGLAGGAFSIHPSFANKASIPNLFEQFLKLLCACLVQLKPVLKPVLFNYNLSCSIRFISNRNGT